jgi:hypothetical protein
MMAKMFYTLEEAKAALGKSEEEIRQFAREGRLREFRDGPRLMFKADQVDQLKNEVAGGGEEEPNLDTVDLGVSDSGGLIGLVDTTGASGTSITLSDADVEVGGSGLSSDTGADIGSGLGSGLGGSGLGSGIGSGAGSSGITDVITTESGQSSGAGMTMRMKDDTALAQDLGLSGSLGGVPSPGRPASGGGGTGTGLSGTASGRSGINVFGHDDVAEDVDPMAQTNISGGIRDQLALEGVGSGSGLLDLTRESDDTSLGAVLDEITPGPSARRAPFESPEGSFGGGAMDEAPAPRVAAPPVYVEKHDPWAPAFGGAALAAAGVTVFGMFVLVSAVLGTRPPAVQWFADQKMDLWKGAGLGVLPVMVFFIVGLILGKVTAPKGR